MTVQGENQSDDVVADPTHEELSTYAEKLVDLRKRVDMEVKANVSEAQKRQKKQYDAKHQQSLFEVGQIFLVKNMKKLSKKGDKMEPNWTGPYEIAECIGNNNYRLRRRTRSKELLKSMFNSTRLKLFNERGMTLYV